MAKVVVITGASGGIGQALCEEFHSQGCRVIGLDVVDPEKSFYDFKKLDLTSTENSKSVYDQIIEENSRVDIFINNAGIANVGPFGDYDFDSYRKLMSINTDAVVFASYYWQEKMISWGGGSIVNIASVAGHASAPTLSHYCASKHAVVGLTRALQLESEIYNIPVKHILVSPGFVDTPIMDVGEHKLPEQLNFMINTPAKAAKKMVEGILAGKTEIEPTLDGKAMLGLNKVLPQKVKNFMLKLPNKK